MKILIINWRSIKDPLEGGAERATMEHARRWVKKYKAKVTWLSPKYNLNIGSEDIEGIHFHYVGYPLHRKISEVVFTFPLFYFLAFWTYLTNYKGKVDVVIDQVHGIPYLTPLYVKEKIVVYIHEVAGEIWDIMYPFPINKIGRFLERFMYPLYKKIPFVGAVTVTKELQSIGINKDQITTINYGVTAPELNKVPQKNKNLTILFLNRLVKMKGPERAIDIFNMVHKKDNSAKLVIAGKGEAQFEKELKQKVKKLHLDNNVVFAGFITEKEKFKLLSLSHVLLNTSFKEGWGLVNIEANSHGTPAVSFKVKGNTESIKENVSGFLFDENDYEKMADKIISLKNNKAIQKSALEYSKKFDWDIVSSEFYEVLKK